MNGRGLLAIGILAAWGAGIAAYAQRELSRSPRERLAEIAARVAPGAIYLAVEREGQHVGFASNTIDTIPGGLQVTDYLVADLPFNGTVQRSTAQSVVRLSRALLLRDFTVTFGSDSSGVRATGRMLGDSLLEYVVSNAGATGDTTRVHVSGPLFLPTLVPLAVALGDPPKVGRRQTIDTFDPMTMTARPVPFTITAESLFVVVDSASYNPAAHRWLGAHADTVRGFRVTGDRPGTMDAWVDEQGRIIAVHATSALTMRRTAYEVAFENWRTASPAYARRARAEEDRWSTTVVSAGVAGRAMNLDTLRVQVRGLDLDRLPVNGGSQLVQGDTVTIVRDRSGSLRSTTYLPPSDAVRQRYVRELRAEPMLEVADPAIVALARKLRSRDAMVGVVTQRILGWVHDSLAKSPSVTPPSAIATLRSRRGDSNEHAQLFVALARAAGIPARTVSGVIMIDGRFYYHAWAEVMLQRWVGVDPTLGQYPTDASHLRLLVGGLSLQAELARIMGPLELEVVSQSSAPARHD